MEHAPIPNTLREHRKKAGLTQLQVANHLGFVTSERISRWEKGLTFPHVVNLFKLAKLYHVFPQDLYSAIESPTGKL